MSLTKRFKFDYAVFDENSAGQIVKFIVGHFDIESRSSNDHCDHLRYYGRLSDGRHT